MRLEREEELKEVIVGKVDELNDKIFLSEYDDNWPLLFDCEKKAILSVLPDVQIEHVGSTSVPELCAKPIIDIIMLVDDSNNEETYLPALEKIGYYLRVREVNWYKHRLCNKKDSRVNLHIFSYGCIEAKRMINFRDILRNNPKALNEYANEKRRLAQMTWKYVQEYADAKSDIVNKILKAKDNV